MSISWRPSPVVVIDRSGVVVDPLWCTSVPVPVVSIDAANVVSVKSDSIQGIKYVFSFL